MKGSTNPMTSQSVSSCKGPRKYSVIEENAIYYAAGYVVRQILKKYEVAGDDRGAAITSALMSMIGEDAESIEATTIYLLRLCKNLDSEN